MTTNGCLIRDGVSGRKGKYRIQNAATGRAARTKSKLETRSFGRWPRYNPCPWTAPGKVTGPLRRRAAPEKGFKELKQNLKIKSFVGSSEKPVLNQIYVVLIMYLLAVYQKFISRLGISVQQTLQLLQVNLLGKLSLEELFSPRGRVLKNIKEISTLYLAA